MDSSQWYAIVLGSFVAISIIASLFLFIVKLFRIYGSFYFLKYVFYPQIHRYLRGSRKTTRFEILVLLLFLIGNFVCLAFNVQDVSEFMRRSGLLSTINLIPLSLGGHMNAIASGCGIKLDNYTRIHRWLGRVAIIEGLIHVITAVSIRRPNLRTAPNIAAVVAAIVFVITICSSLLRQHFYDVFVNLHFMLMVVVTAAIYLHSPSRELLASPLVYLLAAVCLQILIGVLRFAQVLYRNVRFKKPLCWAFVRPVTFKRDYEEDILISDAVHVHVRLSRPWKHRAGQYAYVCIPGVSYLSFAQQHPFYVSWSYKDGGSDYVVFLVQKRRGFTKDLFQHIGNSPDNTFPMRAVIEGPYGKGLNLDSYGTVLLFATGIGIAGQLSYVTQLLEGYGNYEVKTRRIALFWEVESELHTAWVADRMQELLKEDTDRILDIHLFVRGGFLSNETQRGHCSQISERLKLTYDVMDAGSLITSEMKSRKGRTVVSLCTHDKISNEIRETVRRMLDANIHLEELDFRPTLGEGKKGVRTSGKNTKRGDETV